MDALTCIHRTPTESATDMCPITAPTKWTDQTAAAFAAKLDSAARYTLSTALRRAEDADTEAALTEHVREVLGGDLPHVAGVAFYAGSPWDNGIFLDDSGYVVYHDGRSPEYIDFGAYVAEHLTDLYGNVGSRAGLAIIPTTGETEFDDCAADFNLVPWIKAHAGGGQ